MLSPQSYNGKTDLLVCVPIASKIKRYPFEVLMSGGEVSGAALADQFKNLDGCSRQAQYKGKISTIEIQQIKGKIGPCLIITYIFYDQHSHLHRRRQPSTDS